MPTTCPAFTPGTAPAVAPSLTSLRWPFAPLNCPFNSLLNPGLSRVQTDHITNVKRHLKRAPIRSMRSVLRCLVCATDPYCFQHFPLMHLYLMQVSSRDEDAS